MATDGGSLDVDLEVGARSRALLVPLLDQREARLVELHHGRINGLYRAHYESTGATSVRGRRRYAPSTVIHELADAVEGLDAAGQRAWKAAARRDFNVGIEVAPGAGRHEQAIEADAVRRIAELGGRIVVTVYPPDRGRAAPRSGRRSTGWGRAGGVALTPRRTAAPRAARSRRTARGG